LLTEFFYGISAEAKARRDKAMPLINDPLCTGLRRRVMPEGLAYFIDPFIGLAQAAAGTTHG